MNIKKKSKLYSIWGEGVRFEKDLCFYGSFTVCLYVDENNQWWEWMISDAGGKEEKE